MPRIPVPHSLRFPLLLLIAALLSITVTFSRPVPAVESATFSDPADLFISSSGTDDTGCGAEITPCQTLNYVLANKIPGTGGTPSDRFIIQLAASDTIQANSDPNNNIATLLNGFTNVTIRAESVVEPATLQGYLVIEGDANPANTTSNIVVENLILTPPTTGATPRQQGLINDGGTDSEPNIVRQTTITGFDTRGMPSPIEITGGGLQNGFNSPTAVLILDRVLVENNKARNGGGVYNKGTLTITGLDGEESSQITSNIADADGGGIYNDTGGRLFINLTRIELNRAGAIGSGGGLANNGDLTGFATIVASVIEDNETESTGLSAGGGGIANISGGLYIYRSFITNNLTNASGGGINVGTGGGYIIATTISGNNAQADGGGVYVLNTNISNDNLNFVFATIAANSTNGDYGLGTGRGGGLWIEGGSVTLSNTIVSKNDDAFNDGEENCYSNTRLFSAGNNLIKTTASCAFNGGPLGSDITLVDESREELPIPLAPSFNGAIDNANFLNTFALSLNSPAVDAGDCLNLPANLVTNWTTVGLPTDDLVDLGGGTFALLYDQRGQRRGYDPDGDPTVTNGMLDTSKCDIGAYETFPAVVSWEYPDVVLPGPLLVGDPAPVDPVATVNNPDTITLHECGNPAPLTQPAFPINQGCPGGQFNAKLFYARIVDDDQYNYVPVNNIALNYSFGIAPIPDAEALACNADNDVQARPENIGGFTIVAGSPVSLPLRVEVRNDAVYEAQETYSLRIIDGDEYTADTGTGPDNLTNYYFRIAESDTDVKPDESLLPTNLGQFFGSVYAVRLKTETPLYYAEYNIVHPPGQPVINIHPQTVVTATYTIDGGTATRATSLPFDPNTHDYYLAADGASNWTGIVDTLPVTQSLTGASNCTPRIRIPFRTTTSVGGTDVGIDTVTVNFRLISVTIDLVEDGLGTNDTGIYDVEVEGPRSFIGATLPGNTNIWYIFSQHAIWLPLLRR